MPVIGPDTNLFIAKLKQGEVCSSGFTSQDQALGLEGFNFSENHRDGRWERLVRSSCPHAPAGAGRDRLFASFSSAPHPDLNHSSKRTVIARKFHCLNVLLQNHFFKALDVRFVNFAQISSRKRKVRALNVTLGSSIYMKT